MNAVNVSGQSEVDAPSWWKLFVGGGMGGLLLLSSRFRWARRLFTGAVGIHITEAVIADQVMARNGVDPATRQRATRSVLCWGFPCARAAFALRPSVGADLGQPRGT